MLHSLPDAATAYIGLHVEYLVWCKRAIKNHGPGPSAGGLEKKKYCKVSKTEKVYFRSQILERPSIGEYWNISGVPVLPENMIFTFFRTCWCYSEAYNTGTQKWSSIVQYSCTSIWDLKYTFSTKTFAPPLPPPQKICHENCRSTP